MGIARHDERDAAPARRADPARLEVEAVGIAVHLDRHARLGGGVEHALEIAGERRAAEQVATERVPPHLEDGMAERPDQPPGHLARIHRVAVVDARDHDVELLEDRVGIVERPVAQDVALGTAQDADGDALLDAGDLVPLAAEAIDVEAPRIGRARGVIGDRQVAQPQALGGSSHLLDGVAAVGRDRVAVDGPLDVLEPHEVDGQAAVGCGLNLAGVLAQLGCNAGEPERGVERRLGRKAPCAGEVDSDAAGGRARGEPGDVGVGAGRMHPCRAQPWR
jgi:hypothetical protein